MIEETGARRIVVEGRVQGVGFRAWLQREAQEHGVRGWVRNLPNGSVEALLHGAQGAIEKVIASARHGPAAAHVSAVHIFGAELEEVPANFIIKH